LDIFKNNPLTLRNYKGNTEIYLKALGKREEQRKNDFLDKVMNL
jgi:hypothetical protein